MFAIRRFLSAKIGIIAKIREHFKKYRTFVIILNHSVMKKIFAILNEEKTNRYQQLAIVSEYLLNHRKYTEEEAPIINELEDFCAAVDLDNAADFNDHPEYQTLVHNIFKLRIYSYKVQYEFDDPWGKILADFKTIKSENIKQALAPLLIEGVSPTSAATTNKELIALIPQIIKNTELLQELNQRINLVNKLKSGQPFPPFEGVVDMNDKPISFEQLNLKGKMLFIDIWATYCPDCRKELPALETLQQTYKGKPITFVSISVDRDKEAWKTMVKEKKLSGMLHQKQKNYSKNYMIYEVFRVIC